MFCFANVVELNRTPRNKLLSVWPHCFIIQANIIATVVLHIQQIKSKPGDGREAPLWSKPRNLHATSKKRNYNGSKPRCVNANVRKKTVTSPIKFKKSAKLAFMCHIRESKQKFSFSLKKDITIWLKLGRFVIVYDLTKWVKPLFIDFFFLFSAFNRSGLICS